MVTVAVATIVPVSPALGATPPTQVEPSVHAPPVAVLVMAVAGAWPANMSRTATKETPIPNIFICLIPHPPEKEFQQIKGTCQSSSALTTHYLSTANGVPNQTAQGRLLDNGAQKGYGLGSEGPIFPKEKGWWVLSGAD
jgi:hypothetical protein